MGRVCEGGAYDGMQILGTEDELSCVRNEGRVVSSGGSGGCGASAAASMAPDRQQGLEALGAMRALRDAAHGHEVMTALIDLNSRLGPVIESLAGEDGSDPRLAEDVQQLVIELGSFAAAVVDRGSDELVYTADVHERVQRTLGMLVERLPDDQGLVAAVDRAVGAADGLVGMSTVELVEVLRRPRDGTVDDSHVSKLTGDFPSLLIETAARIGELTPNRFASPWVPLPPLGDFIEWQAAARAIEAKAGQLRGLPGPPIGEVEAVPGGWARRYEGCDIYHSTAHGTHEVHGDIRAKYNLFHGPAGVLGVPVTDETGTPDGRGRYNHFANDGSIYWTPTTGPMMVRGRMREIWATQGWELGPMGYPVADDYRLPGLYPQDNPSVGWTRFENGALVLIGNAVAPALAAEVTPEDLRRLVRATFDRAFKNQDGDLGLEARVDLVSVSDWHYGFWAAGSRAVTHRLHGFYDNGLLPDTTFEVELRLRFTTAWTPAFTAPSTKSLVAVLDHLSVHASGLGNGTLANGLYDGIWKSFHRGGPDPFHPEVSDGALFLASFPTGIDQRGAGNVDVVDVLTTAQGGLAVLVNPIPPTIGAFRRMIAQNQIDVLLDGA